MRFQRTLTGGGELLALLRPLWRFIAVVSFGQGVGMLPAWAAPAPTITTLSVTSGGNAVTTVAQGSIVTLTATVMTGSTPVAPGQVNFCDATAKFCTDIHLLGTAQLTANGTATLKFRPGVGSHSYTAVLAEPAGLGPSSSTASSLTVTASQGTGQVATTTYLEASGVPNIFSLTATVPGNENTLPTGTVSFVDASNGNAVLGTSALTSEAGAGFAGSSLLTVTSQNSGNTVLTADFNGDGIPDLVILGNDTISVLLGNGDGTFTAAPSPSSDLPGAIAVGDFNGDGIPDLAVAPALDEGNSEVLLGNGDGTFTIANGSFGNSNGTVTSNSIAAADFNGDGKLDLVETCASVDESPCNSLLILFGNGDGTFMQPSGPQPPLPFFGFQSMAVGDFNGDGQPDLAVTNSAANGVNIFLNSGGGLTAVSAMPATGAGPSSIAAADFNGDGKLDLAVANSGSNNVTILLGNGDGTFTAAASPAAGTAPNSIAVADFNGDGVPDLAVANAGSSNVTILLGNGDGTFTAAAGPAADTGSTSVAAADFNGDGKEDLVVVNSQDSSATALLAETALTIATVNNISPAGVGTHLVKAIYSGDVNYDGSTSAEVSLTVVPPGLTLSGTPVSVVPGATGTSTLTITPTNGFSGTVALECDGSSYLGGANDVPTCSSIPPVTISGNAPTTTTLSIQTQPGTTPGQYEEFVNAVDSSGNLIANTNTVRVAVTVTGPAPGFELTNTAVNIASPGASGTSTLTITPNGFSGTVTLECYGSKIPPNANALDAPSCSPIPPVTISGDAPVTAMLSIQTQPGTTPVHYIEDVKATDPNGVVLAITDVAVNVNAPAPPAGLTLSGTPVSVVAGATGTSTLTITPTNGFSGTVTLKCNGGSSPSGATDVPTCSSIPPVTISGNAPATTTLSIQTQSGTTPGQYMESVNAVDSKGVAMADTTVAVTVTAPAPPAGLTLSGTPVSAVAGATGTSTLTITPTNGFSGGVTLACAGSSSPGGANDVPTCSSIPPVTISGNAPATTTLSIQTQPGTTTGQYMESVNAVDSSGVAMANTTVAVTVTAPAPPAGLTLSGTPVSVVAGATGTSTITIMPSGGFTGSVALSCTVTGPAAAVDLPTCSVAAPPAITGTTAVSAALTVNTTAASSSSNATGQAATAFRNQHKRMLPLGGGGALVAFLFFGLPSRRCRTKTLLSLLLLGAFATIVMGCGGAQKAANPLTTPVNPGTTVGSYMVTVTGSSGTLTASTTVAVTVN